MNDMVKESRTTWVLDGDDDYNKKHVELLYVALAMSGELGELQNLIKKYFRKRYYNKGHTMDDKMMIEGMEDELADVIYYTCRMADLLGIDPEKAFMNKMVENKRRYIENREKSH